MRTLKDIWESQGYKSDSLSTEVKRRGSRCHPNTLYKMNRKQDENVEHGTVRTVCRVLGITQEEYEALNACPRSSEFGGKS